jgi:hypothetical protein
MKSLLNETLDVFQPQKILLTVLLAHVLTQEHGRSGIDSSIFKIFVESLLQVFIQITGAKKRQRIKMINKKLTRDQQCARLGQTYLNSGPSYAG